MADQFPWSKRALIMGSGRTAFKITSLSGLHPLGKRRGLGFDGDATSRGPRRRRRREGRVVCYISTLCTRAEACAWTQTRAEQLENF